MAILLNTPQVETITTTTAQITQFVNDIAKEKCEIHYLLLLEDGTHSKRGTVTIKGYDAVKALYSELDVLMGTGKTFEEASTEILYAKVLSSII